MRATVYSQGLVRFSYVTYQLKCNGSPVAAVSNERHAPNAAGVAGAAGQTQNTYDRVAVLSL